MFVAVVSLLNPDGNEEMYGQAADELITLETSLAKVDSSICGVAECLLTALNRSLSATLNYET